MSAMFETARRLANQPLALRRNEAVALAAVLRGQCPQPEALGFTRDQERDRQYGMIDGVAIIPVRGVLYQGECSCSWATGYDWIRRGVLTAAADPEVKAIVLDIDSPGGEVSGCFDLVDAIYAIRGVKPIRSILSESAYSAAYALASATDHISVPRTGGTGSIGVIWMHVDWSAMLDKVGLKVTFVTCGARKADGHSEIPLSKEALERFQADIDILGALFVETVARNRNLPIATVRGMEAATFLGGAGVQLDLADAVMAPDAAFLALLDTLG